MNKPDHSTGKDGEGSTDLSAFVCELIAIQTELKSFVRHLVPYSDHWEDIVQEVNLLVMEKRRQFELGTNFRAWVYTIARNVTMKWQKRSRNRREFAFEPDVMERLAEDFADQDLLSDERVVVLRQCLQKVGPDERRMLLSRYETRGSTVSAAERLGVSQAAVRALLFRLRIALRRCVERKMKPLPGGTA